MQNIQYFEETLCIFFFENTLSVTFWVYFVERRRHDMEMLSA